MNPLSFDLHIFDIDDTLVNTKEAYWSAQEVAIKHVYSEVSQKNIKTYLPKLKWLCATFGSGNLEEYFSAFLASTSDIFPYSPEKLNNVVTKYRDSFKSNFTAFGHVKTYLRYLLENKRKLAIVSNGAVESQLSKLKKTNLLTFFPQNTIFVSGQFPKHLEKPSPYMLKKACEDLGVQPEKTVFYGNSDVDVLAGNLAGLSTVHFARTTKLSAELSRYSAPDSVFSCWSALIH